MECYLESRFGSLEPDLVMDFMCHQGPTPVALESGYARFGECGSLKAKNSLPIFIAVQAELDNAL